MRTEFDNQLGQLRRNVEQIAGLCQRAIARAGEMLAQPDAADSSQVDVLETQIDRLERDIETLCLRLLLKQQPVARDLRQISAALKMITDFERIGDQAQDIAHILKSRGGPVEKGSSILQPLFQAVQEMLKNSITAYLTGDLNLAKQVIEGDAAVDSQFANARDLVIRWIAQAPQEGEVALDLLMIAKYLERIGDHATNIAEWAEFSVTGVHRSQN